MSPRPEGLVRQKGTGQVFFMTSNALLAQILQLPPDERMKLVAEIWDSLDPATAAPMTAALAAELDRREAAADADPSAGVPWSHLKRDLQAKLR
jgi:putative addiction module component (TIGR02574 family)